MDFPKRKPNRLQGFDYSQNGAYFVTICTKDKHKLFGDIVGADSISARMVDSIWNETIQQYKCVQCPIHVVMPNHFHAIITIEKSSALLRDDMESSPTISKIIQSFKRHTTIEYIKLVNQNLLPPFNGKLWQRSFHDHIIRDEHDYEAIWQYIDSNPSKWVDDCFYMP